MLNRSLYFLFENEGSTRKAIEALEKELGLDDFQLHAITNEGHTLYELPGATVHRKTPAAIRMEKVLWYISIGVFVLALIGLALTLLAASWFLAMLLAIVVVGAQLSGFLFGNRIPNAQLDRFRTGLEKGYIVLKVDVPSSQRETVMEFMRKHYPDATTNVSNWHIGTIGL